jgi:hypothetical protein
MPSAPPTMIVSEFAVTAGAEPTGVLPPPIEVDQMRVIVLAAARRPYGDSPVRWMS